MDNSTDTGNQPPKKNKLSRFVIYTLLILLLAGTAYYFICGMTYSEGTRSGILTKVSKKGFIFKTYEGELIIGGLNQGDGAVLPGVIFKFSIIDKEVYDKLESDQGRKVILHYKQVIKNFFWQGETDYFVHQVTFVQ